MEKLASALAKGRPICTKARDDQYISEYENQVCIKKDELTRDTFNFEDLMNCCEKDQTNMKRKNKQPIGIVSKRFARTQAYTHGYIIKLEGRYVDGRVKFTIESDDFNLPGDLNDFINGKFNIKFVEVYLKINVDMSKILGGVICDHLDDNVFWVYNKYWEGDLPSCFLYPDNLTKIDKKLREKITRNMNKNFQENSFNENVQGENIFNENALEDNSLNENISECSFNENALEDNSLNENISECSFNKNALEDNFSLNENVSEGKNKLEANEESDLDKHADKKNKTTMFS
ncbi:23930_t:CDS:2 [Gigaspora margarita]|uniref:23930_t:CDS:1 n=1 Tax=Gigaspora margarita TaxID=4874 RepID=A0ABM8W0M1_GIGMA|nr:23930_t:CDS:2 [Gigaspora margarita]